MKGILGLFPESMRWIFRKLQRIETQIMEIRVRVNRPIVIEMQGGTFFLTDTGEMSANCVRGYIVCEREMNEMFAFLCEHSMYAYEEQLCQGFLTVKGGHRVGVLGQAVVVDGKMQGMKHIAYLNIRIAHECLGAGNEVMPYLYEKGRLLSCLVFSLPGGGKTTMLRDLIRQISDGNRYAKGMRVSVADERSELAACCLGVAQNDLGMQTDIFDGCPKAIAMEIMLRTMSPQVIAVDEIGTQKEMEMLWKMQASGCAILATMHGNDYEQIVQKIGQLWQGGEKLFSRYIWISGPSKKITVIDGQGEVMERDKTIREFACL